METGRDAKDDSLDNESIEYESTRAFRKYRDGIKFGFDDATHILLLQMYNAMLTSKDDTKLIKVWSSRLRILTTCRDWTFDKENDLEAHSGVIMESNVHETLEFKTDETSGHTEIDGEFDATRSDVGMSRSELGNFLARPVRICTGTWTNGDFLSDECYPWHAFLTNESIRRKIYNYYLIQGKLKIEIVINGNSFFYSRAILSYCPLYTRNTNEKNLVRSGTTPTQDCIRYSQRPHVYIDPCTSQGGSMVLPFVWYDNWLPLPNEQAMLEMGKLDLRSFRELYHANNDTDDVDYQIFASMEDVRLAAPTTTAPALDTQAGVLDEYGQGIISKPASAVALMASKLKNVAIIGPYARATELGASAVSAIAGLAGYCRPINLEPIRKYKPTYGGNIANTEIEEAVDKLSFDPKQELSIDPRIHGYGGKDDMTLSNIWSKESYFSQFDWAGGTSADTLLYSARVTPVQYDTVSGATRPEDERHMTAQAFAVLPFAYWKGSMTYRFVIVASKYHRGRLRIVYNPAGNQDTSATEFTSAYNWIIDINKTRDFEVTIPWNASQPYKRIQPLGLNDDNVQQNFRAGATAITNVKFEATNGTFYVYVLNELTTVTATDPGTPSVLVFQKCGDDFEVGVPESANYGKLAYQPLDPQSGETEPEDAIAPEGASETLMDAGSQQVAVRMMDNLVFFGETVTSFRAVLKRYCFHEVTPGPDIGSLSTNDLVQWERLRSDFPCYRGYDSNGLSSTTTGNANLVKQTLMNYLTPAYVTRTGGIRWKHFLYSTDMSLFSVPSMPLTVLRTDKVDTALTAGDSLTLLGTSNLLDRKLANLNYPETWAGAYITKCDIQPIAEVELPFYRRDRFAVAADLDTNSVANEPDFHWVMTQYAIPSSGMALAINSYVASGEDFNLCWFLNAPVAFSFDIANVVLS